MRTAALTSALVVFCYAATAQLSLLPQVGLENSKTNISFNDLTSFSPLGMKFSPQVGLRLDYKFKQGHGPWIGISNSRAQVAYSFTNPETGMDLYTASVGNMQVRLEAGYQHSFKQIYLNPSNNSSKQKQTQTKAKSSAKGSTYTYVKKGCGGKEEVVVVKTQCVQQRSTANKCGDKQKVAAKKDKGPWMRIQPSLGVGFIPSVPANISTKVQGGQTTYEYKAGNMNTALIAGSGFEFGRGNQRLFTVSLSYMKGLGNLDKQTLTTVSGTKTTHTTLQSEVSAWSMKVGIPFSLSGRSPKAKPQEKKKECLPYKMQSRSKCSGRIRI